MNAAPSFDDIAARAPQLIEHTVAPPALSPLANVRALEADLRNALEASSDPRGWAMLGNLLARRSLYLPARNAYLQAVSLDPSFAQAHLAIAELSSLLRDGEMGDRHMRIALRLRRRYDDPDPAGDRIALLMLLIDAPYAVNAPLELLLDRSRVAVHKLYVGETPAESIPAHDLVWNAFGSADASIVGRAKQIASGGPVINDASHLIRRDRDRLPASLANCRGARAVSTRRVNRAAIMSTALPALVRPAGTQAGAGLAYVQSVDELSAHVERFPAHAYDVTPFVEYRSADGYYRKYRAIIVDGRAFPYHLAISPRWMVHYQSSPMGEHAWMREEELAFLREPRSVFPRWDDCMACIGDALGLDYVGLDFTRMPDGTMLVFEADPTMLVHDEEAGSVFEYKRPFVAAIRGAAEAAIVRRVHSSMP